MFNYYNCYSFCNFFLIQSRMSISGNSCVRKLGYFKSLVRSCATTKPTRIYLSITHTVSQLILLVVSSTTLPTLDQSTDTVCNVLSESDKLVYKQQTQTLYHKFQAALTRLYCVYRITKRTGCALYHLIQLRYMHEIFDFLTICSQLQCTET